MLTRRGIKAQYDDAILLPSQPFADWLGGFMAAEGLAVKHVAKIMKVDGASVRRRLRPQASPRGRGPQISDRVVEAYGLALDSEPTLATRLYPELGDL